MLVHAVRALAASRTVDIVVVAAPEDTVESVASMLSEQSFPADVVVVTGGETRQDSVARALITLPSDVDVVLVHDAARPLVPEELVTAVVAAVRSGHPAVVPGLPVVDTIKRVDSTATWRRRSTDQAFARSRRRRASSEACCSGRMQSPISTRCPRPTTPGWSSGSASRSTSSPVMRRPSR